MQVWDQVKVIGEGSYAGEAGVVQAVNAAAGTSMVKLDTQPEAIAFENAELQFLGRWSVRLEDAKPGLRVVILAKDDFYAYVHGWSGLVAGLNNGFVHVKALNPDGQTVSLFVPAEQLGRL